MKKENIKGDIKILSGIDLAKARDRIYPATNAKIVMIEETPEEYNKGLVQALHDSCGIPPHHQEMITDLEDGRGERVVLKQERGTRATGAVKIKDEVYYIFNEVLENFILVELVDFDTKEKLSRSSIEMKLDAAGLSYLDSKGK